jgi:hypothetical protein
MRGLKRGENEDLIMMTAFQKAEALAGQRYDRDKLLAVVGEVTTHFRMPAKARKCARDFQTRAARAGD